MTSKKVKNLQSLKENLKKSLPERISKVIKSYEDFSEHPAPIDAKGFSAHHTACKAAVVHAETLLKLARWTEGDAVLREEDKRDNDWSALLEEAQSEDAGFEDET